jgi:hypothetical protein
VYRKVVGVWWEKNVAANFSAGSTRGDLRNGYRTFPYPRALPWRTYRAILELRDFCLCFNDGGLVQIRYDIQDRVIIGIAFVIFHVRSHLLLKILKALPCLSCLFTSVRRNFGCALG